ncbi:MAG: CRTAC1 family protein [Acidobacteriota bacterium]
MTDRWNAAGLPGGVFVSVLLLAAVLGCAGDPASEANGAAPDQTPPDQTPAAEAPLVDVTADSGLHFQHRNGQVGQLYMAEFMGSGGAVLDVDGDGDLDLYLVQSGTLDGETDAGLTDQVFRNVSDSGGLRFEPVDAGLEPRSSASYGQGVTAGDVDNDGRIDLYVTALGHNRLLRNRGDGTFDDLTAAAGVDDRRWSLSAAFADLDGDGWLDLVVGNYIDFTVANHRVCRSENGAVDYCGPSAYPPQSNRVFRNLGGDGGGVRFADKTADWGFTAEPGATLGVVAADLLGDARLELYIANDQDFNRLWSPSGPGDSLTFVDQAMLAGVAVNGEGQKEASMGVLAADFNGDGSEDLLIAHLRAETHTLYLQGAPGGGSFFDASLESGVGAPSRPFTGFGLAHLDLDRDGDLDVYSAHGAVRIQEELARRGDPLPLRQPDQLYRNDNGAFRDVSDDFDGGEPQVGRGVVAADFDDDGDRDLVVINNAGPAQLLEHRGAGAWIGVRAVDPALGGRDAIGARVDIEAAGAVFRRRVDTGGGYASGHDPRVAVGLAGLDVVAVDVSIVWPGGRVEKWSNLDVGRYHLLRKGGGDAADSPAP